MIKVFIFISFELLLISCEKRKSVEEENEYRKKLIEQSRVQLEQERIQRVQKFENDDRTKNYKKLCDTLFSNKIYNLINDTINKFISLNLYRFNKKIRMLNILTLSKYIYFNSKKDKLISLLVLQSTSKCYLYDYIYIIAGEKINDGWWFYYIGLNRPERIEYSKNTNEPLPYWLLEGIGINVILNRYASENYNFISDENFEINIDWKEERRYYLEDFYNVKAD